MTNIVAQRLAQRRNEVESYLQNLEKDFSAPLYLSTDIRDSACKSAVVDVNFFPAGFNNLNANALGYAALHADSYIKKKFPQAKKILLVAEENTRNSYYLENLRVLANLLQLNNYHVVITTAFEVEEFGDYQTLTTASGRQVQVFSPRYIIEKIKQGKAQVDLIVLNNDLIRGVPAEFVDLKIPIIPSFEGGWHSRRKSTHFQYINEYAAQLSEILDIDPWLISTYFEPAYVVDINSEQDRQRLFSLAQKLFEQIRQKYQQYQIDRAPTLFLKADYGTYGMGIITIEDPQELLDLNRKKKNKLFAGKGSVPVMCYLLQEGVPTLYRYRQMTAEPCLYFVGGHYCGSFYRMHGEKHDLDNLNSKGAVFVPAEVGPQGNADTDEPAIGAQDMEVYVTLSRIASIASMRELADLEKGIKNELCIPR